MVWDQQEVSGERWWQVGVFVCGAAGADDALIGRLGINLPKLGLLPGYCQSKGLH